MKIIYPIDDRISLLVPNPKSKKTLDEIAKSGVPKGLPYKIINDTDIPIDSIYFEAWEADFSDPDGYGEQVQKTNFIERK